MIVFCEPASLLSHARALDSVSHPPQDTPLFMAFAGARMLRLADGRGLGYAAEQTSGSPLPPACCLPSRSAHIACTFSSPTLPLRLRWLPLKNRTD